MTLEFRKCNNITRQIHGEHGVSSYENKLWKVTVDWLISFSFFNHWKLMTYKKFTIIYVSNLFNLSSNKYHLNMPILPQPQPPREDLDSLQLVSLISLPFHYFSNSFISSFFFSTFPFLLFSFFLLCYTREDLNNYK